MINLYKAPSSPPLHRHFLACQEEWKCKLNVRSGKRHRRKDTQTMSIKMSCLTSDPSQLHLTQSRASSTMSFHCIEIETVSKKESFMYAIDQNHRSCSTDQNAMHHRERKNPSLSSQPTTSPALILPSKRQSNPIQSSNASDHISATCTLDIYLN